MIILVRLKFCVHFLDADISVLGWDWERYEQYSRWIRKEYAVVPAILYRSGRKKVLQHFLNKPFLFQTKYYQSRLEEQARANLKQELSLL